MKCSRCCGGVHRADLSQRSGAQVRNLIDGKLYALKRTRLTCDEALREKILREVAFLSSLTHPHVTRCAARPSLLAAARPQPSPACARALQVLHVVD